MLWPSAASEPVLLAVVFVEDCVLQRQQVDVTVSTGRAGTAGCECECERGCETTHARPGEDLAKAFVAVGQVVEMSCVEDWSCEAVCSQSQYGYKSGERWCGVAQPCELTDRSGYPIQSRANKRPNGKTASPQTSECEHEREYECGNGSERGKAHGHPTWDGRDSCNDTRRAMDVEDMEWRLERKWECEA